jgi:UDP-N-acetylmuramoyl-tripeptide--D-alanyl-D-alanine ligase
MQKEQKRKILLWALRLMANLILQKYQPQIVSITGSVGKTSAKEAIFTVLSKKFIVRKNDKNYNNEIGLPLTIIGAESGGSSLGGWLKVFFRWLGQIVLPVKYPKILILEMGADRPGDIKYLTDFVSSTVGVITEISSNHIEFFKTLEAIAEEKGLLVKRLAEKAVAVLNLDNPYISQMQDSVKAAVLSFGFSAEATVRATDVAYNYLGEEIEGINFKLNYKGSSVPVRLNGILARHQIYAALAAAAVGINFNINLVEISEALGTFSSPCGRMNLLKGIKKTHIIDDTYNAAPASTQAALEVLKEIKSLRKIAVLGDMLELGEETENEHAKIGKQLLAMQVDLFFAFGKRMKFALAELEAHGFPKENICSFEEHTLLQDKLKAVIQEGDLILVKGSQGMRMEKIVAEIMAEPLTAEKILCRQNKEWKAKPFMLA